MILYINVAHTSLLVPAALTLDSGSGLCPPVKTGPNQDVTPGMGNSFLSCIPRTETDLGRVWMRLIGWLIDRWFA